MEDHRIELFQDHPPPNCPVAGTLFVSQVQIVCVYGYILTPKDSFKAFSPFTIPKNSSPHSIIILDGIELPCVKACQHLGDS